MAALKLRTLAAFESDRTVIKKDFVADFLSTSDFQIPIP
jgi:hypothetical protein